MNITDNVVVVLTAGGESSRFRNVAGAQNVQKSAFILPNGDTMIERTIRTYKTAGLSNFVILLYHNADSVKNLLGDGSRLGVSIAYSHDPDMPVGRGGAVKYAFNQGILDNNSYLIVHNPDDQLLGNTADMLKGVLEAHFSNEKNAAVATAVMVGGVRHEFTGFTLENNRVVASEMYPLVPIPTHIGLTVFSPGLQPYFDRLFDLQKKTDFEAVLFPILISELKLSAHMIPEGQWISVNDEKGLKKLIKALETKQ